MKEQLSLFRVTGYCHISSQRGRIPTQVRPRRTGSEGIVGGARPNRMKMRSSLGRRPTKPTHISM